MKTTYTSKDGKIMIILNRKGFTQIAWALFVEDQYKGSKVLPANNTAIVQNFGYNADEFTSS